MTLNETIAQLRAERPVDVKWQALNAKDLELLDSIIVERVQRLAESHGFAAKSGLTFDPNGIEQVWTHGDVQSVELIRAKIARLLSMTSSKSPSGF